MPINALLHELARSFSQFHARVYVQFARLRPFFYVLWTSLFQSFCINLVMLVMTVCKEWQPNNDGASAHNNTYKQQSIHKKPSNRVGHANMMAHSLRVRSIYKKICSFAGNLRGTSLMESLFQNLELDPQNICRTCGHGHIKLSKLRWTRYI